MLIADVCIYVYMNMQDCTSTGECQCYEGYDSKTGCVQGKTCLHNKVNVNISETNWSYNHLQNKLGCHF